jgi:CheY-like chemotaxis protein
MQTKILLVEDGSFTREGIRFYLQQHGFQVLEADNADTAWQIASAEMPAVTILDIVIPINSGSRRILHQNVGVSLMLRLKRGTFIKNSLLITTLAEAAGLRLRQRQTRALPPNKRYLPPPSSGSDRSLESRMRREVILTFEKPPQSRIS